MRTDCRIDSRQVICRNASLIGYSTRTARVGSFLIYADGAKRGGSDRPQMARMLGRVHADGRTYILAMVLSSTCGSAFERWIAPDDVLECYDKAPAKLAAFFFGELPRELVREPQLMRRLMDHGTIGEEYIDHLQERVQMFQGRDAAAAREVAPSRRNGTAGTAGLARSIPAE